MSFRPDTNDTPSSVTQLAAASGVSLRTIPRLEVGGRAGLDPVRQLAAALRVKPADLMAEPPNLHP